MNLSELIRYADACLAFETDPINATRQSIGGARWLGADIEPRAKAQLRLKDVLSLRPMAHFPDQIGWFAALAEGAHADARGAVRLTLQHVQGEQRETIWTKVFDVRAGALTPLVLNWPKSGIYSGARVDLSVHALPESSAAIFLAVSQIVRRSDFIGPIKGLGIEIGPGMTPQILPGPEIDVLYADEMTKQDWQKVYSYKKDKWEEAAEKVPWDRFRSGGAFNLPAEDNSLDFIFGSHVFEHLVNPIQHLSNWLGKLRPGGSIFMIHPHLDASLDFRQAPSLLADLIAEYQKGGAAFELKHYERMYGASAKQAMAERRSLHVHFYNPDNLAALLGYAQQHLGARAFRIHHHRNYREMFYQLIKA